MRLLHLVAMLPLTIAIATSEDPFRRHERFEDIVLAKVHADAREPPVRLTVETRAKHAERAELEKRVAAAKTLDQALDEAAPEFGDAYAVDRKFAALDLQFPGQALFEKWADAHLHFEDLEPVRSIDVAAAVDDVEHFRGESVCASGVLTLRSNNPARGSFDAWFDRGMFRHDVRIVGPHAQDLGAHRVRLCGIVIGRWVAAPSDDVTAGLVIVGMVDPKPPSLIDWIFQGQRDVSAAR